MQLEGRRLSIKPVCLDNLERVSVTEQWDFVRFVFKLVTYTFPKLQLTVSHPIGSINEHGCGLRFDLLSSVQPLRIILLTSNHPMAVITAPFRSCQFSRRLSDDNKVSHVCVLTRFAVLGRCTLNMMSHSGDWFLLLLIRRIHIFIYIYIYISFGDI